MQNVYDLAHELARSLKETDQYKDMKKFRDQVNANESLKKMVDDFGALSVELQSALMSGQQPDEELMKKFQATQAIVMQDPTCAALLNAEMAFSTIIADISSILTEAIDVK